MANKAMKVLGTDGTVYLNIQHIRLTWNSYLGGLSVVEQLNWTFWYCPNKTLFDKRLF